MRMMDRMTIIITKIHKTTTNILTIVSYGAISSDTSKDAFVLVEPFITAGIVSSQNETLGSPKFCLLDMNVGDSFENVIYSRDSLVYVGHNV